MSHVTVFNPAARSHRIPTNPGKYLTEVRDEACKKFNVNPDQFTLKYNNKPISLSQQIRLANLPQGARLELVQASRSPTVISVALQLPAAERSIRLTEKFASTTSLWEILRHFESGQSANYNFTQRGVPEMAGASGSGRLNYEMPVITVMPGHREHSDFTGLQQTLAQLGFDRSALLRLSFKNSGTPLEEAMAQISHYFKSSDPASADSSAHSAEPAQSNSISDMTTATPEASVEVEAKHEVAEPVIDVKPSSSNFPAENTPPSKSEPIAERNALPPSVSEPPVATASSMNGIAPPGGRQVQVFAAPTSSTPKAARNAWNEQDYVPTIEHAKAHQASLQNRTRNTRLLSDKELDAEEAARQEKLTATAEKGGSLRVRMPDQTQLQFNITKTDTAKILYDFVEGCIEYKEPFQLKYFSAKGQHLVIPRSDTRLIQDLRLTAKEVVTFLWDEKASNEARLSHRILRREYQDQAQQLEVKEPEIDYKEAPKGHELGKTEGKRKAGGSSNQDKESKLKSILGKGLFKR
ncbi:GLUT4 regulating protein TUG-domain-containing protein [Lophiotrema nucula]|uniref:GLUT4 regulating protein TUG-domain-containing protein n=1 Tax=Lophiotrema nucula TaxID=690887 RepID=A0A6A5YRB7_9PLEO|nr:GLUT4 regulating protein TUG-domain-containing protein [Lophiotrema nucula]